MIFFLQVFYTLTLFAQNDSLDQLHDSEVLFFNNSTSSQTIRVKIFPVSMVFNGWYNYDLKAKHPLVPPSPIVYNYVNGRNTSNHQYAIAPGGSFVGFNHDRGSFNTGVRGSVSFGIYKIEVLRFTEHDWLFVDTCTIEWDAGFPSNLTADVEIHFRDDNNGIGGSGPRLTYNWSTCAEQNVSTVNRKIEAWNQCSGQTRSKYYGDMIYSTANGNNRTLLPQDYRNDCNTYENYPPFAGQYGIGLLTMNLTIDKDNVSTRLYYVNGERYNAPDQLVISPNCTLALNNNRQFVIKYDPSFDEGIPENYNKFYVKPYAVLKLNPGSNMIFEKTNWLVLECDSKVIMGQGSSVLMKTGSKICFGGAISGSGSIIIEGTVKNYPLCQIYCPDIFIEDSTKLIVEQSAGFEIPDSVTYIFKGKETALVCKDSSEVKFGKGSKLIFEDGARISANGCKFVSYDSTQIWDGIYLSDVANDTLINCVIQNAYNGINITQPTSIGLTEYSTVINNCTFKNSTNTKLLNQVYIDGADDILIKDCSTESGISSGFATCIVMQY